jgi:hypothetical protein
MNDSGFKNVNVHTFILLISQKYFLWSFTGGKKTSDTHGVIVLNLWLSREFFVWPTRYPYLNII